MQPSIPRDYREAYLPPEAASRLARFLDELLNEGIVVIYSGTGAIST